MSPNSLLVFQALLHFGEATKTKDIASFLNLKIEDIEKEKENLQNICRDLGLNFITNKNSFEITLSDLITQKINKQKIQELKVELSESALQTLACIIYKPNSTKAEIDFIRGVDGTRSLKNLVLRGLTEKLEIKNRKTYIPTTETLKYLGLTNLEDAPLQKEIAEKLQNLINHEN